MSTVTDAARLARRLATQDSIKMIAAAAAAAADDDDDWWWWWWWW